MLDYYGFTQFRGMPYESTQPPLYYVGTALLLVPLGEDRLMLMYAARLVSVLLGVGTVWALWWGLRTLWPGVPLLFWGVPTALTLLPQFTFVTSTVTNDAACVFFGALLLAVWAGGLRAARERDIALWRWGLAAGVVTALGLLSKLTMVVTVPGTLLWLWWLASGGPRSSFPKAGTPTADRVRRYLTGLVAMGVALVVLVGWWVVRNMLVYGEPTGTRAIFDLYHSIYWSRQGLPPTQLFSAFSLDDFVTKTFRSFWAVYGWAGVVLDWWVYLLALLVAVVALFGLVRGWIRRRDFVVTEDEGGAPGLAQARQRIAWLSGGTLFFAFLNMLFYDSFVDYQPQARYVFVAIAPAFVLLVLGLMHATPKPRVNRVLVWCLFGALLMMQLLSIPVLLDRWAGMAAGLQ
jgi:hypothetical protein